MRITNLHDRTTLKPEVKVFEARFETASVRTPSVERLQSDGWDVVRRGRYKTKMRRRKLLAREIEDRVWTIFYKMGFKTLNGEGGAGLCSGPEDQAEFKQPTNQIDVFGMDEDIAIIVECKSAVEIKNYQDFQKDLALLVQHRSNVRAALSTADGESTHRKVGAVFVVWNAVLSETDFLRAKNEKVLILDRAGLQYYETLVEHIQDAARYQLLAEVFAQQPIEGLDITVPAVEMRIGNHEAYTFCITPEHLLKISYVAHRARGDTGEFEDPYQRMINRSKLVGIRQFIQEGGVFATNIVVNFRKGGRADLRFEQTTQPYEAFPHTKLGWLHLPRAYQAAWIIDGQHRLFSYSGDSLAGKSLLSVTAFHGLDSSEQANMFVTINSKQKRVSPSLLTELYASLHWGSRNPEEQISSIVSRAIRRLATERLSPFEGRIRMADEPGTSVKCLTMQSIAAELSKSPFFIVHKQHGQVVEFGPLWVPGKPEQSVRRTYKLVASWFDSIVQHAGPLWDLGSSPGGFLAMNDGVAVSLEVLRSVVQHLKEGQDLRRLSDDELANLIKQFGLVVGEYFGTLVPKEIQQMRRQHGNQGRTDNYRRVQSALRDEVPDFNPTGLADWLACRADEKMPEALQLIGSIETRIRSAVVGRLIAHFGSDGWWTEVPKSVRTAVVKRWEDDNRAKGGEENYLRLPDLRSIVLSHWQQLFQPAFGYGLGNKSRRTDWLGTVNTIRTRLAQDGASGLTTREFGSLEAIEQWLTHQGL